MVICNSHTSFDQSEQFLRKMIHMNVYHAPAVCGCGTDTTSFCGLFPDYCNWNWTNAYSNMYRTHITE